MPSATLQPHYSRKELLEMGFATVGQEAQISRLARFYSPPTIHLGDRCRIDDFCLLTGHVRIGRCVHVSAFSALFGNNGIVLEDYSGVSARCTLYSESDDFSGEGLVGPFYPDAFRSLHKGEVRLHRFVQLGAHTVVFPGVSIGEGSATGAMSLVNQPLAEWGLYVGVPVRKLRQRSRNLLDKHSALNNEQ